MIKIYYNILYICVSILSFNIELAVLYDYKDKYKIKLVG